MKEEYVTREEKAARARELKEELDPPGDRVSRRAARDGAGEWDRDNGRAGHAQRRHRGMGQAARRCCAHSPSAPIATTSRAQRAPTNIVRKTESDIYDLGACVSQRGRSLEERNQTLRDNAMRAVEQASFPHPDADVPAAQERIASAARLQGHRDEELARRILHDRLAGLPRAFNKLVARRQPLTPEEQRVAPWPRRTDATGGYAVPCVLRPDHRPHRRAHDDQPLPPGLPRRADRRHRHVHRASPRPPSRRPPDEAAAATEGGPTFGGRSSIASKVQALVTFSIETDAGPPRHRVRARLAHPRGQGHRGGDHFALGAGAALGTPSSPSACSARTTVHLRRRTRSAHRRRVARRRRPVHDRGGAAHPPPDERRVVHGPRAPSAPSRRSRPPAASCSAASSYAAVGNPDQPPGRQHRPAAARLPGLGDAVGRRPATTADTIMAVLLRPEALRHRRPRRHERRGHPAHLRRRPGNLPDRPARHLRLLAQHRHARQRRRRPPARRPVDPIPGGPAHGPAPGPHSRRRRTWRRQRHRDRRRSTQASSPRLTADLRRKGELYRRRPSRSSRSTRPVRARRSVRTSRSRAGRAGHRRARREARRIDGPDLHQHGRHHGRRRPTASSPSQRR